MSSFRLHRRALVPSVIAALLGVLLVPAHGQFLKPRQSDSGWDTAPRLSIPSAQLLPAGGNSGEYEWRGTMTGGRKVNDHGYEEHFAISPALEVGWDHHKVTATGKSGASVLAARTTGYTLRSGLTFGETHVTGFLQERGSHADYATATSARTPPGASTWTLGGLLSRSIKGDNQIHLLASGSSVRLKPQSSLVWTLGAGIDHRLMRDLSLQGSAGLFLNTGDVSATNFSVSTGLHYENRVGLTFDIAGNLLPSGTPLAGDPMSDAAVFMLDPTLSGTTLVHDLSHRALGYYTIRAGYTARF